MIPNLDPQTYVQIAIVHVKKHHGRAAVDPDPQHV